MAHRRTTCLSSPLALALMLLTSCSAARLKSKELERVAKDWCLTIRASQVIPCYPLTEDLLPGDVFLTSTPIGNEVKQFQEKGFLPLDNLLTRLAADDVLGGLSGFYEGSFGVDGGIFPKKVPFSRMPDVKFPSYSFDVSSSNGLNLAVPVQGVPVGINYLGTSSATGSITIADAQTVGVDLMRIDPLLDAWSQQHRKFLAPYGTFPGDAQAHPTFVRVVTRIFYTGRVSVHLADSSARGAEVEAGVELPLSMASADASGKTVAQRQQEVVDSLNSSLSQQFGGHLKIAAASSRSITLDESFERPVVIGYLAYDRQVLPDGSLGPAVSTLAQVSGAGAIQPRLTEFDSGAYITAWYTRDELKRTPLMSAWLERNYPGTSMSEFLTDARFEEPRLRMVQEIGMR